MMTSNHTELSSQLEALRVSISIDNAQELDRHSSKHASTSNFDELRYLDTRPIQHMTATWGS